MQEIQSLFIINKEGNPLLVHEKTQQGSEELGKEFFYHFIAAFQMFLAELGSNETNEIELGKSVIYSIFENKNQVYFILKCSKSANSDKMRKKLTTIHDLFLDKSDENQISENLRVAILELVKSPPDVQTFLKNISLF